MTSMSRCSIDEPDKPHRGIQPPRSMTTAMEQPQTARERPAVSVPLAAAVADVRRGRHGGRRTTTTKTRADAGRRCVVRFEPGAPETSTTPSRPSVTSIWRESARFVQVVTARARDRTQAFANYTVASRKYTWPSRQIPVEDLGLFSPGGPRTRRLNSGKNVRRPVYIQGDEPQPSFPDLPPRLAGRRGEHRP